MDFGLSSIANIFMRSKLFISDELLRAMDKWYVICSNGWHIRAEWNQFTNIIEIICNQTKPNQIERSTRRNWSSRWTRVCVPHLFSKYTEIGVLSSLRHYYHHHHRRRVPKILQRKKGTVHVSNSFAFARTTECISIQSIDFVFNMPFTPSFPLCLFTLFLWIFIGVSLQFFFFRSTMLFFGPNTQLDQFTSTPLWSDVKMKFDTENPFKWNSKSMKVKPNIRWLGSIWFTNC